MRILVTGLPIYSHLFPALVPLARAMRERGHEVAVATSPALADQLAEHAVPHVPLPNVPSLEQMREQPSPEVRAMLPDRFAEPGRRIFTAEVMRMIARVHAGPFAMMVARDVLDVAAAWRPDVILHEPHTLGGYLAAQRLGIPSAVADIAPYAMRDLPHVHDVLNQQRQMLGLAPVDDPLHPHRMLRVGLVPESWYPTEMRLPSGRYYDLPSLPVAGSVRECVAGLPGDAPLVLASLGSLLLTLPDLDGLLLPVIEALGLLDCRAVLSLGGHSVALAELRDIPPNVRVLPFVPQRRLLEHCGMFLTHAGFGSVRDAMSVGVPMVALPSVSDGVPNGARLAELGFGLTLDAEQVTGATLAEACKIVLTEPDYRSRVLSMRGEMLALPGVDTLLDDLAALC